MSGWESLAADGVIGFGAGLIAGLLHFIGLKPTANLFAAGHAQRALALQLARIAFVGLVLYALTRFGALALVAGFAGIVVARSLVLKRITIEAPSSPPSDPRTEDHR